MSENGDWLGDVLRTPGWLSVPEALALRAAARDTLPAQTAPVAVEIGSYQGRSTIAIATGIKERGAGCVYAIDPHTGNVEHQRTGHVDTETAFLANIERSGLRSWVTPVRAFSHDACDRVPAGISLLFVDGSHEYPDVVVDIRDWTPKLLPGAFVMFNDHEWPGVNRALRELVARPGSPFVRGRVIRGSIAFRYDPAQGASLIACLRLRVLLAVALAAHLGKRSLPRPVLLAARAALRRLRGERATA